MEIQTIITNEIPHIMEKFENYDITRRNEPQFTALQIAALKKYFELLVSQIRAEVARAEKCGDIDAIMAQTTENVIARSLDFDYVDEDDIIRDMWIDQDQAAYEAWGYLRKMAVEYGINPDNTYGREVFPHDIDALHEKVLRGRNTEYTGTTEDHEASLRFFEQIRDQYQNPHNRIRITITRWMPNPTEKFYGTWRESVSAVWVDSDGNQVGRGSLHWAIHCKRQLEALGVTFEVVS